MADKSSKALRRDARGVSGDGEDCIKVHKFTITTAHLTAAAASQDIDISVGDDGSSIPANANILAGSATVRDPISGGTISAATLGIGDVAAPTELVAAGNAFVAGHLNTRNTLAFGASEATAYGARARVATTGGNVNTATRCNIVCRILYTCAEQPS